VAGTVVTALILGLFAARSIVLGDALCCVMAVGIGFGFGAGVVARLALRPVAALLDLIAIAAPAAIVTFMQPDLRHVGLGLLILMYVVASFEMVRLSFNASINQTTLKRQFEQLSRSDQALYRAKEGRGSYVLARELRMSGKAASSAQPRAEGLAA